MSDADTPVVQMAGALISGIAALLDEHRSEGVDLLEGVEDRRAYLDKVVSNAELFCHFHEGHLAGLVACYCNDPRGQLAYVTLVLVARRLRGQGMGRALMQQAMAWAAKRGLAACELEVHADNAGAVALYRQLGFEPVARRPSGKLHMRCALAASAQRAG